jgi:N-acetylmuramoyl-L-alanine amidase
MRAAHYLFPMPRQLAFALILFGAACAHPAPTPPVPRTTPPSSTPTRLPSPTPRSPTLPADGGTALPPIPLVEGPLAVHVVYPPENGPVPARDSNYMVGSVGNGHATLTINGHPATVYPNGAFMAFIPTPPATAPRFDLVAMLGPDTVRVTHNLKPAVEKPALPLEGRVMVDSSELMPRATNLLLRDDERTTVSLRIPANASATLVTGAWTGDTATAIAVFPLARNGEIASRSFPASELRFGGHIFVTRGRDTTVVPLTRVAGAKWDAPQFVRLGKGMTSADTDAVVYGRTLPNDNYKWFLLPGTVAELTGRLGAWDRVRVAEDLEMWVADADVDSVVARPSRRVTFNGRIRSTPLSADLVIPMTSTPAFFVEEHNGQVDLVMYGVVGNTDIINYPTNDTLIRAVTWEQESADRIRFTLHLTDRPIGYMALWEHGTFVLRIRRAPRIDPANPLRGRTIALDPGHPPAGATGPTSLYEGQAVLWVAEAAKAMLEAKGATVVMTRTTMDTLGLPPRRTIPRRADADAFVSIHLNAYPDGVNPFVAHNGSGTYFYRTHSEPLARTLQQQLVGEMGLYDEGVFYRSLAVTVQSWFPAALTEGAYLIIPEQEAALRTTSFQERYAKAVVEGLEAYFRSMAR